MLKSKKSPFKPSLKKAPNLLIISMLTYGGLLEHKHLVEVDISCQSWMIFKKNMDYCAEN